MAVKEIMEALARQSVENKKLSELVKDIRLVGDKLELIFVLPNKSLESEIRDKAMTVLKEVEGVENFEIKFAPMGQPVQSPGFHKTRLSGIKHLIVVGSGKGGVGKSTVAVNIALALSKLGYRVGLLDGDIYGPSIPTMLGLKNQRVEVDKFNRIIPAEAFGMKVMSVGFLLPSEDTPLIWRGPMLMKALTQFLFDVKWGSLDFLVLDLPPGTGDVQLTLAQTVEIDGAIVVTTPQDVALADVKKAVVMFKEVGIPVLGVVENMAYFVCPESGNKYYIFGKGRVSNFALAYGLKILGSVPIEPAISETSDSGVPIVESSPDSQSAKAFLNIAKIIAEELERR
ncbi:P-loop NTPase [Thermocrinis jamiesonii]|uniref:P-loop NTPase n=1 Tax=Thermocrinis jamiesonii TaxID=1302351 RepID=UPI0004969497|nr:Mrp/NBP35 family ATP-binding protein [Thermocrinis jamiesonii]